MIGGINGKKGITKGHKYAEIFIFELVILSTIGGNGKQWNNLKQLCINLETYKEENGESHICLVGY